MVMDAYKVRSTSMPRNPSVLTPSSINRPHCQVLFVDCFSSWLGQYELDRRDRESAGERPHGHIHGDDAQLRVPDREATGISGQLCLVWYIHHRDCITMVKRAPKRLKTQPEGEAGPSRLPSPRLFHPFRALGFVCDHVPISIFVHQAKGALAVPHVNILTSVGRSWLMWEAGRMGLVFVGKPKSRQAVRCEVRASAQLP